MALLKKSQGRSRRTSSRLPAPGEPHRRPLRQVDREQEVHARVGTLQRRRCRRTSGVERTQLMVDHAGDFFTVRPQYQVNLRRPSILEDSVCGRPAHPRIQIQIRNRVREGLCRASDRQPRLSAFSVSYGRAAEVGPTPGASCSACAVARPPSSRIVCSSLQLRRASLTPGAARLPDWRRRLEGPDGSP